jgi:hypothetical protein
MSWEFANVYDLLELLWILGLTSCENYTSQEKNNPCRNQIKKLLYKSVYLNVMIKIRSIL